jgi:hypothetical protein
LFKERQVRGGEGAQRGQLDHRLDLILKQHWQHNNIAWHGLEQSRTDRHGVRRQVGKQHAPLLRSTLPDQALAGLQALAMPVLPVVGECRQELQARRLLRLHLVDHALLGIDQRHQL